MKKNQKVGTFAAVPYDWRKPTKQRFKARMWNPNESRVITPRAWGWGYDVNWYRVLHPFKKIAKK